jgi:hypothetical protein
MTVMEILHLTEQPIMHWDKRKNIAVQIMIITTATYWQRLSHIKMGHPETIYLKTIHNTFMMPVGTN